ncbi:hypothetical protein WME99_23385 [Sorangium sp. So ce136]|uniref:hypothetical protein n=1 Tax=Sorangium sp. So ce136 TaxID=3133284 RepID=UPI003F0992EA
MKRTRFVTKVQLQNPGSPFQKCRFHRIYGELEVRVRKSVCVVTLPREEARALSDALNLLCEGQEAFFEFEIPAELEIGKFGRRCSLEPTSRKLVIELLPRSSASSAFFCFPANRRGEENLQLLADALYLYASDAPFSKVQVKGKRGRA